MKTIPLKVWNRIEILQQPIAAIAHASTDNRNRWVDIYYNVNRHSVVVHPPHLYCVIDTEYDTSLLEVHAEHGDEDLAIVSQARYYATDINELYALLTSLHVDPEAFNAPWHVNHPQF
ncbi:hypothetical protein [Hymenobacter sedentarius]|uniref:hypothetical protein n=1 Tax=Hymenobacter sedentarius TaxID=1411621 RepID=UPI0012FE380B|nr:hypothetical protein [Hymenobacter sedentarius]